MAITRVWIDEGCTMCGLCSDTCPEVFELEVINGANLDANEDAIKEAAGDCPEEVIKFDES